MREFEDFGLGQKKLGIKGNWKWNNGSYGGVIELGIGFVLGIELFLLLGLVTEEVLHHLVPLLFSSHRFPLSLSFLFSLAVCELRRSGVGGKRVRGFFTGTV